MNTETRVESVSTLEATRTTVWPRVRRLAYPFAVLLSVAIVFAGQLVEDMTDSPPLQMLPPAPLLPRWTVVALVLYSLVMSAILIATARTSLAAVQDSVAIPPESFDGYESRLSHPSIAVDLVLIAISGLVSVGLFVVLGSDLLLDDPVTGLRRGLPADMLAAVVVLAAYTVVGWALLRLVSIAARLGRVLGQLTREPLRINVFDTSNLIPFGNMALTVALVPAVAIIILLVGLGAPKSLVGWSVLVAATVVSVLALLLPLRGVHRAMATAKEAALLRLNVRINELYETMSGPLPTDVEDATRLNSSTSALIPMRRVVQEMTSWPFRDTVAFGRAVLIASAPLIYTTLSELIRIFVIGPIAPP